MRNSKQETIADIVAALRAVAYIQTAESPTKAEREEYMSGLVVHHVNGDKKDNRRCNLRFMSRRAHARLHSKRQKRNRLGRFV